MGTAGHRSMEDWSISLGNTLLASIVCLIWYVVGLWEEKDIKVSSEVEAARTLTSAEKKVRSVDKEENFNNGSSGHLCCTSRDTEGGEGHLYMLPEEGRHLLIAEQSKRRQEEIQQSTMQLQEEKAPIQTQKMTTTKSLEVAKQEGPTTFQWPQNASLLESARPTTSTVLSSALEDKLKDLGIFRTGGDDEGSNCQKQVDGAARMCGLELTKKQVRVSFDTFMAKSRPGLESDEEVKEMSPKPKRKCNNKRNNHVKEKKAIEPVKKEKKESKTMIRTGGWSNPAWKMVQPQPSPVLVRAF